MALLLELGQDMEALLKFQAEQRGIAPEQYARELLLKNLPSSGSGILNPSYMYEATNMMIAQLEESPTVSREISERSRYNEDRW